MRITFILSSLTLSGGVNVVIEYANRLSGRGHTVMLVVPHQMTDPIQCASLHSSVLLIESQIAPKNKSLTRLLATTNSMVAAIPPSDVLVATHTPTVAPVLLASLLGKTRHTLWLYMDYAEMFTGRPIEMFLLRHAPRWFSKVLAISAAGQQDVLENTGVRAEVLKIGLSHPVKFDTLPQKYNYSSRILYIGDTRPRKGLTDFLHAAKIIHTSIEKPVQFVIVSKDVLTIDEDLPIELHITPSIKQLGELYYTADIFVSASWAEGFGLPPLEAMAYGTPVVLTDSRGVRDYARHGKNCLLVPPRMPKALAQSVILLLNNVQLAKKLGENGKSTAIQYNWGDSAVEFDTILQTL